MTALSLDHITLTYPDGASRLTALDDVSLSVDAGEFVALTGPSGSGKSSLLAVAATLIRPDHGTVMIDGVDATALDDAERTELRRDRIGIVFQQPNLIDSLTALEQLTVMATLAGHSPHEVESQAKQLLESVGVADVMDRRPGQFSGGQRQRVNIARALMGQAKVLLVDEPTSALDHERGAEIMQLLRQVTADLDLATIVVTHDVSQLEAQDRVAECRDGRLT